MGDEPQQAMRNAFAVPGMAGIFGVGMQLVVIPGKTGEVDDIRLGQRAGFGNELLPEMKIIKV
jgi:hypothetical protein